MGDGDGRGDRGGGGEEVNTRLSRISTGGFQQVGFFQRIGLSKSGLLTSTKPDL